MKKIIALVFTVIILAGMFTGCGKNDEVLTLNVYNWGEYISDGSEGSLDVNKEFEKYYSQDEINTILGNYKINSIDELEQDVYDKYINFKKYGKK